MKSSPEGLKSIVRALKPHHVWIKALLVIDLVGWAIFEFWIRRDAGGDAAMTADGLWNARALVWAALLLFDNLVIVWWCTHVANKRHHLEQSMRSDANRPFAVIDLKRSTDDDGSGESPRYVARNVGAGFAVNIFYVVSEDAGLAIRPIGALAGHTDRALPEWLERPLRDARGAALQFVVVSEAPGTHADRWTLSANVLLPTGEVAHRVVALGPEKRSDSLRAWLDWHWPVVKTQMSVLDSLIR